MGHGGRHAPLAPRPARELALYPAFYHGQVPDQRSALRGKHARKNLNHLTDTACSTSAPSPGTTTQPGATRHSERVAAKQRAPALSNLASYEVNKQ
jgi:hypothetical protein